jgi:hypothetical protein
MFSVHGRVIGAVSCRAYFEEKGVKMAPVLCFEKGLIFNPGTIDTIKSSFSKTRRRLTRLCLPVPVRWKRQRTATNSEQ